MRIVFMGTPDFAAVNLAHLLEEGRQIAGVFTQPDKPVGRKQTLTAPPVKKIALEHNIPVYQPEKIRDGQALEIIKQLLPDIIVVVAYVKILPKEILELPRYGCVNVHGSLLPKYRGAAPIQWSVINGDKLAGVTTMYMAQGLDTGDMILKVCTSIGENETSGELYDRLAHLGAQCLSDTLRMIEQGNAPREKQDEDLATYAPMLDKEIAKLDFTKSAQQVHNLIRGLSPWPVAITWLEGKKMKVHQAVKVSGYQGEPGTVLDDKRLIIGCIDGAVELLSIQMEGGKRMLASDFLRGHPVKKGTKLGLR